MGAFNFTIPSATRPLADILTRLPRGFRDQAEKGLLVLAGIPSQHYQEIVSGVIVALESKKAPFEGYQERFGIQGTDIGYLFAASMLVVPMLAESSKPEEFLDVAVKTRLIDQSLSPRLEPFVNAVLSQRSVIVKAIKRSALPAQVLPFFSDIEIAVDMRFGFAGDEIDEAVPVALVHIDTDAEVQEIWFQCSKHQLLQLKDDIDEALKKMEAVERAWGKREAKD